VSPPACAKPPPRYLQAGESDVEKDVLPRTLATTDKARPAKPLEQGKNSKMVNIKEKNLIKQEKGRIVDKQIPVRMRNEGMKSQIFKVFLLIFALGFPFYISNACTIFTLTDSKKIYFGNNEDYSNPETRIWFIPYGKNFYGCMYVGFNNGWGQGGLNEKGLAYDWVAGYLSDYVPSPNLQKVLGNPSHRMLETCATVDEAILFYQKYREPSFSYAKLFIADISGNSVIIQANNGTLEFLRTNKSRVLGYGEHKFNQHLSENSSVELSNAKNILSSCIQIGEYGTKYSTIYDLKTKNIYVYSNTDFENVCILNLEDELKKGEHYYEIPHIKEQVVQSVKPLRLIMKRNIILFFLIQHWWICLLVFVVLGVGIVAVKRRRKRRRNLYHLHGQYD